jgi:hypothetical protein
MRPLRFLLGLLLSQSHYFISPVTSAGCYPGSFGLESVKLLLIYADTDSSWSLSVKRELEKTQAFDSIALFDGRTATPSLLELQKYHTTLVWATGTGFRDASLLGDVLADYWDWGGAVIVAMFANHRSRIRGRFGDFANGYMLIDGSRPVHDTSSAALGEVRASPPRPLSPAAGGSPWRRGADGGGGSRGRCRSRMGPSWPASPS